MIVYNILCETKQTRCGKRGVWPRPCSFVCGLHGVYVFGPQTSRRAYDTAQVHDYVGREPSGQDFNSFELTADEPPLPFNPMINSGAITACTWVGIRDEGGGGGYHHSILKMSANDQ